MPASAATKIAEFATSGSNVSTTGAVALTSAVAEDSVIVLCAVGANAGRTFTPSSSAGLTWTRVVTPWPETTASTTVTVAMYYAVVTADLTTSDTITVVQDQTSVLGMIAYAFTGVDLAAPIADFSSGANGTTTSTLTLPSLDAVDGGSVLVFFGGGGVAGLPVSSSVPSTRIHGTNPTGASSNRLLNIAVDTSGVAATITPSLALSSGSMRQAGIAVALNPATPPAVTGTLTADTPAVTVDVPSSTWSGSTSGFGFTGTLTATTPTVTLSVPTVAFSGTVSGAPAGSLLWMWTGSPTATGVVVHARLSGATSCRLAVSTSSGMTSPSYVAAETPDTYGIVRFQVTGLTANTRYHFQIADTPSGGSETLVGTVGTIRTLGTAGVPVASRKVVLGGCLQTNTAVNTGLDSALAWGPDWAHFNGDFFYNANNETNEATWVGKYNSQIANVASLPGFLAAGLAAYESVSDHDSTNTDNGDSNTAWAPYELAAWQKVVPHLAGSGDSTTRDQQWDDGRVSYFMIDIRHVNRSPGSNTDNSSKTMLGAAQKARLLDWLDTNPAPFKVIISDSPWMGAADVVAKKDAWWSYSTERAALIAAIASQTAHVELWHGDGHGTGYATDVKNTWGSFPILWAAGYYQDGGAFNLSTFSDYFTNGGAWLSVYGRITIEDDGTTISRTFDGIDALTDTTLFTYTTTVDTTLSGSLTGSLPAVTVAVPSSSWSGTVTVPVFSGGVAANTPTVTVSVPTVAWSGTASAPGSFAGTLAANTPSVDVGVPLLAWAGSFLPPGYSGVIAATTPPVTIGAPTLAWSGSATAPSEAILNAVLPVVSVGVPEMTWTGSSSTPTYSGELTAAAPVIQVGVPEAEWSGAFSIPIYSATLIAALPAVSISVPTWSQTNQAPSPTWPSRGILKARGPRLTLRGAPNKLTLKGTG